MKVIIRPVQEDELPELTTLAIETFITAFGKFNNEEDMQSYLDQSLNAEAIRDQFCNPYSYFYFALLDHKPVGYLKLNILEAQTEHVLTNSMEIERIYVHEKYQGRKIGIQLFEYAIKRAKEQKVGWVWLGVWENNLGALKFYRRIGFEAFDKHTFTLGKDIQTDILMRIRVVEN